MFNNKKIKSDDTFESYKKTTNKPIVVYKTTYESKMIMNLFYSNFHNFGYIVGERYFDKFVYREDYYTIEVYNGFHSYKNNPIDRDNGDVVGYFIIPKGTTYVEGIGHDGRKNYCSEQIIYFGKRNLKNWIKINWFRLIRKYK